MIQAILVFVITLKVFMQGWINWVWAAIIVTVVPYLLTLIVLAIFQQQSLIETAASRGTPIIQIVQLCFALGFFFWLGRKEWSATEWFVIGVSGYLGMYGAIPYIVPLLLG